MRSINKHNLKTKSEKVSGTMREDDAAVDQLPINKAAVEGSQNKKPAAAGVRPWLLLDSTGQSQIVEAGKYAIMRRTGLPGRDLRILDYLLSYPSTVVGRERAIVINLENLKAIITAQEVLLLNPGHPYVATFADELQRRIIRRYNATKSQEIGANTDDVYSSNLYDLEETPSMRLGLQKGHGTSFPAKSEVNKLDLKQHYAKTRDDGPKLLPFEFVALEACLEATCSCLENEARTLEQEGHLALDILTTNISTLNLERVRQMKSRLVALTSRVQKVRDEMEQLLNDDKDMADMYLTEKLLQRPVNSSINDQTCLDDDDDEDAHSNMNDNQISADFSLEGNAGSINYEVGLHHEQLFAGSPTWSKGSSKGTHTSTTHSSVAKQFDVEELEMLLEAYFIQIDGTLNKLSTMKEYVDDTEDYINIMLDDKQNKLLQMGVMLTTATLVTSFLIVVAGILGINIHIPLFDRGDNIGMSQFLWAVGGGIASILVLYVIVIAWYKHKRLLD